MAVITLRPGAAAGEADLRSYCRERLAAHRYPRVFEFRDVLPENTLGKVLKDGLAPGGARAAAR